MGSNHVKAVWRGTVLAESRDCVVVEGNYYFPADTVNKQYLRQSATHTVCAWKGKASYFDVVVNDEIGHDAAWYYPEPTDKAAHIKDYIAFWKGVEVVTV